MELIIGGAFQGKLTYALKKHSFSDESILDLSHNDPSPGFCCYTHVEAYTKRAATEGIAAQELFEKLIPFFRGAVVISREIGCGIVPLEGDERSWREVHGKLLSLLANEADSVIRIFCGLETVLK